jgi:hypothetical protein
MKPTYLAMLAMAIAASAGSADGEESTRVYRQGNSTATITQGGGSSQTLRRVTRGPNSQAVVQQQGGNTAVVTQQGGATTVRGQSDSAATVAQPRARPCSAQAAEARGDGCDMAAPKELDNTMPDFEDETLEDPEEQASRSPAEREISRKFGMELQVSDSFRRRFLDRMSPR